MSQSLTESTELNWKGGSYKFADLTTSKQESSPQEIDEALATLQLSKEAWVRLPIKQRLELLDQGRQGMMEVADRWVYGTLQQKEASGDPLAEAEEWVSLAVVFRALQTIKQSLHEIRQQGQPRLPGPFSARANGQIVARVFPLRTADRLLFPRFTGEVWLEPGQSIAHMRHTQAAFYRGDPPPARIALVLGAGNASFLPVIDMLHKLFVEGQVVILKLNPVNAYIGPLIEEGFQALIARGFLRLLYGAGATGSLLCQHPAVDELHLTGSDKTYEAIVFGPGPEGEQRKVAGDPINTRRFTGELGNVSPVIIVPGPWSEKDLTRQATQLASWIVVNAGFACLAPRVMIQHASWPDRRRLLERIGSLLAKTETRMAYYPGAAQRHAMFLAAHPDARLFGDPSPNHLPWTLVAGVDPANKEDICFRSEAFCGLMGETALEAADVPDFINRAVQFANDTLWGTLCATLIVHPQSLKDARVAAALEGAVEDLRYGTVAINAFPFYSAYFMSAPWGGYPGHDIYDIQSGTGKTFNFLMLEEVQKSILRAPFRRIDPLVVTARSPHTFARKLALYEYDPAWQKLPGLMVSALRC
jgi:acyl-CoA reductase-like NAD-dependent aldehyde dehydrogenase